MPPIGGKFECPICKRSFSSPGGLGGHRRVHYPSQRDTSPPAPNNGETQECSICHTSWPSMKSLYGHMSKHQNRLWRGMMPPPPPPPLPPPPPPPPPPAVQNGGGDQVDAESEGAEGKRQLRDNGKEAVEEIMSEEEETLEQLKKKCRLEMGSSSRSTGPEKNFLCSVCGREFESYHALGGHKSHHNVESSGAADEETETNPNHDDGLFRFDLNELPPPEERGEENS